MDNFRWGKATERQAQVNKGTLINFKINLLSMDNKVCYRAVIEKEGHESTLLSISFHDCIDEAIDACNAFYTDHARALGLDNTVPALEWSEYQIEWSQDDVFLYTIHEDCYMSDGQPFYCAQASNTLTGATEDLLGWDYISCAKSACAAHSQRNQKTS